MGNDAAIRRGFAVSKIVFFFCRNVSSPQKAQIDVAGDPEQLS